MRGGRLGIVVLALWLSACGQTQRVHGGSATTASDSSVSDVAPRASDDAGGLDAGAAVSGTGGSAADGGGVPAAGNGGGGTGAAGTGAAGSGSGGLDGGSSCISGFGFGGTGGCPAAPGPVVLDGRMPDEAYPNPETVTLTPQSDDCAFDEPQGQVRRLVPTIYTAGHVLITDAYAYYVNEKICRTGLPRMPVLQSCELFGELQRIPRCGGDPPETVIADVSEPVKLAAGGGFVYALGKTLQRVRESDKSIAEFTAGPLCFGDIATDATHVYVYDRCAGHIARAAHGTSELETLITLDDSTTFGTQLAVRGSLTFFECGRQICWHDRRDGSRGVLPSFRAQTPLFDLAAIEGAVFAVHDTTAEFARLEEAKLTRVALDRTPPSEIGPVIWRYNAVSAVFERRPIFHDLVATGDRVYLYQQVVRDSEMQILEVGASGAPTLALPTENRALSLYGERLYWSGPTGGLYTALPLAPRMETPARVPARSWTAWALDEFSSFAIGPQGEVVVWRMRYMEGHGEPLLEKYDAQGKLVWSHSVTKEFVLGPPRCVVVDAQGTITAAVTLDKPDRAQALRVRWSAEGNELNRVVEDRQILSCALDGDSIWIGGSSRLEKRAANDALVWSNPSVSGQSDPDALYVTKLKAVPGGALALVDVLGDFTWSGRTFSRPDADNPGALLVQLDGAGTVQWIADIQGAGAEDFVRLEDGRTVLLAGQGFEHETTIAGRPVAASSRPHANALLAWFDGNGGLLRTRSYSMPWASGLGLKPNGHLLVLSDDPSRPLRLLPSTAPGAGAQAIVLVEFDAEGELIEAFDVNASEPAFAPSAQTLVGLSDAHLAVQNDRVWISGTPTQVSNPVIGGEPRPELAGGAVVMQLQLP